MDKKTLQNMTRFDLESLAYNLLCEKADLQGELVEMGQRVDKLNEGLVTAYKGIKILEDKEEDNRQYIEELEDTLTRIKKLANDFV